MVITPFRAMMSSMVLFKEELCPQAYTNHISKLRGIAGKRSVLICRPDDRSCRVYCICPSFLHRHWIAHRTDGATGGTQEAYEHVGTRVGITNRAWNVTRDRSRRSDGRGTTGGPKLRGVEAAEGSVGGAKEDAKIRVLRGVKVESGDNPAVVDGSRHSAAEEEGGGVRSVECSELAVDGAQEAMSRAVRVEVTAQDRPARRHCRDVRDEKESQKCGRELKQGEFAAGSAKETAGNAVGVCKTSRDRACGAGDNFAAEDCARARNFQRGDGAVLGAQEDVSAEVRTVGSHDQPLWGYEKWG